MDRPTAETLMRSLAIDTVPLPERPSARRVRVVVPVDVAFNLDRMQKVTAGVLERLGCPACHSGWDIRFDLARSFFVDEKLNVRSVAGGIVTDG